MPRPSKHEQARVLYQYYLKGHSIEAIAKSYGATPQAVYYLFRTYNMPCNGSHKSNDKVDIPVTATPHKTSPGEEETRRKILEIRATIK